MNSMNVDFTLNTDGAGLWSREKRAVRCLELSVDPYRDEETGKVEFGELRVRFDVETWTPRKHGLIYTDDQFERELKVELSKLGFTKAALKEVGYSEQGMQGSNYVSLDVGTKFCREFAVKSA